MSDITGDAITIHAAEKIEDAIEHVGYTSSQQQVGKAIKLKLDAMGDDFNARGAVKADKNTKKAENYVKSKGARQQKNLYCC